MQGHLSKVGAEACASVRVLVIGNKAMATRAVLEREAANWLDEAGFLPPGNGRDRAQWEVRDVGKRWWKPPHPPPPPPLQEAAN